MKKRVSSYDVLKGLTIVDLFEGLWSVGTRYRRWRQP